MKSFMEYVQLKNEGLFDFFKPKKTASASTGASTGASDREEKRKSLDTYDPYTAKYSPLIGGSNTDGKFRGGRSYKTYTGNMSPDEIAAAEDQDKQNNTDSYLKKFDPAIKYIAASEFAFPNGTKKIEDDIENGRFSYDTSNVPKMMLYLLNNHQDNSYMPFFGSLVKNDAVKMIPYNLSLRIMETYGESGTTWTLKSFIARHLVEKTPSKIKGLEALELIRQSLKPTDGWGSSANVPDFLQHIKEEDIKDIWLKFFERRPDLAKNYYEKNGERMRLNQKYKQANDTRYQKPNDMENLIFSMFGEKNESFKIHKKSLFDW